MATTRKTTTRKTTKKQPPAQETVTEQPSMGQPQQQSNILSGEDLAAIKEQLKQQILDKLKDDQTKNMELEKRKREEEQREKEAYIEKMKQSTNPWVDVFGWVNTKDGVKVELEWNNAFVDYLKVNGITGADEDQIVQKWISLLLRDIADDMDGGQDNTTQFE